MRSKSIENCCISKNLKFLLAWLCSVKFSYSLNWGICTCRLYHFILACMPRLWIKKKVVLHPVVSKLLLVTVQVLLIWLFEESLLGTTMFTLGWLTKQAKMYLWRIFVTGIRSHPSPFICCDIHEWSIGWKQKKKPLENDFGMSSQAMLSFLLCLCMSVRHRTFPGSLLQAVTKKCASHFTEGIHCWIN